MSIFLDLAPTSLLLAGMYRLSATDISKWFGTLKVFSKLNIDLITGESIAVIGPNGSGKTTCLKTMLSIYRPSRGKVTYFEDDTPIDGDKARSRMALVAPYLNLYDQLTAEENLKFFASVSGAELTGSEINAILERMGLEGRGLDYVGTYSSGMQQRLKYAVAVTKKPAYLFLDEPTSSLDDDGKKIVFDLIDELRSSMIILIATNESEEYNLAGKQLRVSG